jgi:TolB-like protein
VGCIAALPKALDTDREGCDFVLTVPGEGYKLVIEAPAFRLDHLLRPSVAVLPFQDHSGTAEGDNITDSLLDQIISALSRFRDFAVITRNWSFLFRGRKSYLARVGAELSVRFFVTGSVEQASNRF